MGGRSVAVATYRPACVILPFANLPEIDVLSTKQAAACLGVSVSVFRGLYNEGKFPAYRVSARRTVYDEADLRTYLDSVKTSAPAAQLVRPRPSPTGYTQAYFDVAEKRFEQMCSVARSKRKKRGTAKV